MRAEDIIDAIGQVGDDLLEEAERVRAGNGRAVRDRTEESGGAVTEAEDDGAPGKSLRNADKITDIRTRRPAWRKWGLLAACLVVAVAGGSVFAVSKIRMGRGSMASEAAAVTDEAFKADEYAAEAIPEPEEAYDMAAEEAPEMEEAPAEESAGEAEVVPMEESAGEAAVPEEAEEPAVPEEAEETAPAEEETEETAPAEGFAGEAPSPAETRQIRVTADGYEIVFELNDTPAADSLLAQLPLTVKLENYGNGEMVFYPPEKLDTADAVERGGEAGTLAYFSAWGDVVMYYEPFEEYQGLFVLGEAVSGAEYIGELSGAVTVEAAGSAD